MRAGVDDREISVGTVGILVARWHRWQNALRQEIESIRGKHEDAQQQQQQMLQKLAEEVCLRREMNRWRRREFQHQPPLFPDHIGTTTRAMISILHFTSFVQIQLIATLP